MANKVKPIIGRVGGKSRLAPWIVEHLTRFQWSIYCEPFAGSAAVYFRLVSDGVFEKIRARGHHPRCVLNDADSRIVQLFRTCRDYPDLLAHAVAYTPYSREEHRLAQGLDGIEDEIEQARRYLVDGWQSFKYMPGDRWGTSIQTLKDCRINGERKGGGTGGPESWHTLPDRILAASPHLQGEVDSIDSRACLNAIGRSFIEPPVDVRVEMARRYLVDGWQSMTKSPGSSWGTQQYPNYDQFKESLGSWQSLPDRLLAATEHLKKCYIENDDAVKCIERWATPHTAIYADPPYVGLERYYAHNAKAGKADSLDLHYRLAATLNTVEAAAVAVSYYPCDLVDELYPEESWERHYRETVASSAGITRNSKTRTRPKRQELLLVRKQQSTALKVNLSGQLGLF